MNIKKANVMKYAILIILSVLFVSCVTANTTITATFTATGTEIDGIRIYFPTELPDSYTYLGRIYTINIADYISGIFAEPGGILVDLTREFQQLAVDEAILIGADALIMIDQTTYDAISF